MALRQPPISSSITTRDAGSSVWLRWLYDLWLKTTELDNRPAYENLEVTVTADDLDSGLEPIIKTADSATARYKIRDIILADGNDFGASGDKGLAIVSGDETLEFTVVPSATLKSLSPDRWGSTAVPFPTDTSDLLAQTAAGDTIKFKYSGGSTGYGFTGSVTFLVVVEKTVA